MSGRSVTIFLPASSGAGGDGGRTRQGSTRGDAHEQALFGGRAASELERLSGLDGDDLVHDARVEGLGHEVGHEALDAVRAGGTAGQQGRLGG